MLTRLGWSLLGAVVGLYAGARALGLPALALLAAQGGIMLAGALAWTSTRHPHVSVVRDVSERMQVGREGRVDLEVRNTGRHRTPTLAVADAIDGGRRTARFLLAPLAPGASSHAAYRIPTDRRGRYRIGPLQVAVGDPFGLTRTSRRAAGTIDVLVHPRVHDVIPPPEGGGDDLDYDARNVRGQPEPGGEFHALRDYQSGDDLRRVHWRSTARRGTLMIRQEEARRRAPVVVLLDVRSGSHERASFETAVEAAASIVTALDRDGRPVTLMTTAGERIGSGGRRHLTGVLDALAVIEPGGPDRLENLFGDRRAPALVAIMGRMREGDLARLNVLVRATGLLAVVATRAGTPAMPSRRGASIIVDAGPSELFARAWNERILRWVHGTSGRSPVSLSQR